MLHTYRISASFPLLNVKRIQTVGYPEAERSALDFAKEIIASGEVRPFGVDIYREYIGGESVYQFTWTSSMIAEELADNDIHLNAMDVHEAGEWWPAR